MEECAPLKELEESEKAISGVVRHAQEGECMVTSPQRLAS